MKNSLLARVVLIVLAAWPALAQFGKNKVQYDRFNWSYLETPNFDIYFYQGGDQLAEQAAPIAEQALKDISQVLNWRMRKRIALLIYNSHSDFQQTNVTLEYLTEGIGGFTEIFKNRAVVAFDGSLFNLWHVIRHELVHVVINDMIYGGNVQSIISGRVRLSIPDWMNEGLAEFISYGWGTQSDLIMRDLALSNEMPKIEDLEGYLAYQGGLSVYRFIAAKYGIEKIGQIWAQMKGKSSAERGIKAALGIDMKELSDKWQRWLRNEYWPEVADRVDVEEVGTQLTDHKKLQNYYNTAPAITPNGDKIALMSDRKDYADIFLISSTDGKVIKKLLSGQRTPDLEELKWLNPRLSWSPDGKQIALAVKAGARDALVIYNVETQKRQRYEFPQLEEIFTAAWAPNNKYVAFVGLKADSLDLYLFSLKSKKLIQLTHDGFADFEPAWSPDSKYLIFASQRGRATQALDRKNFDPYLEGQTDLFYIDVKTRAITRLTDTPWSENYPLWANTQPKIIYTSDYNGISNLWVMDLATRESVAITNVLTGIYQPSLSRDDLRLAFAGYANFGWDIYLLTNPLEMTSSPKTIKPTRLAKELVEMWENPAKRQRFNFAPADTVLKTQTRRIASSGNYSNYIFAPQYQQMRVAETDTETVQSDTSSHQTADGKPIRHPYKTNFSLDLIESQAGYSTFWGLQGTTVFAFSDILGNHRFEFGSELYVDLENSDYYLAYLYLGSRTNYAFTGFHSANFWYLNQIYMWRLRNYGGDVSVWRPFNKFSRVELGLTSYNVERNLINMLTGTTDYSETIRTLLPWMGLVYDNSLWGYFYPIDGWRLRTDFIVSPKYHRSSLDFKTVQFDLRRYFKADRNYSFALRLAAGLSEGTNAQRFFVGGEENWINQHFREYHDFNDIEAIYFSDFITPLRGARYYERKGTRYFLTNLEFRYPFIKLLALGWPLPMTIGGIQGVNFLDFGSAWYQDKFQPFGYDDYNGLYMRDLVAGYGCGVRLFLGYFMLKIDVAWRFDFNRTYKPAWYFSLGTDF